MLVMAASAWIFPLCSMARARRVKIGTLLSHEVIGDTLNGIQKQQQEYQSIITPKRWKSKIPFNRYKLLFYLSAAYYIHISKNMLLTYDLTETMPLK
jgi:hypothetical protein